MLYLGDLIIKNGQNTKKSDLKIFIFEQPRVENRLSSLCPSPLPPPRHPIWVKSI